VLNDKSFISINLDSNTINQYGKSWKLLSGLLKQEHEEDTQRSKRKRNEETPKKTYDEAKQEQKDKTPDDKKCECENTTKCKPPPYYNPSGKTYNAKKETDAKAKEKIFWKEHPLAFKAKKDEEKEEARKEREVLEYQNKKKRRTKK